MIERTSGMDVLKLQLRTASLMAESDNMEQAKVGRAMMDEINKELKSYGQRRVSGGTGADTAKPASGGGPDFGAMGFKQDKKTGNWQNPNTGVYFRNNNSKIEAWSNKRNAWVPTGK